MQNKTKAPANKYGTTKQYEKKLQRVMERLGVTKYQYDWTRSETYIEFVYKGNLYRFEHSLKKAKEHQQNITEVSDLFAQLVISLEDLARLSERGIYELQSWIEGMKALPQAVSVPACFAVLGLDHVTQDEAELSKAYKVMAKLKHPDMPGGSDAAFQQLQKAYKMCLTYGN